MKKRTPNVRYRTLLAGIALLLLGLSFDAQDADFTDKTIEGARNVQGAMNASMAVIIPALFLPLIWALYGKSIERWIPSRANPSGRGFFTRPRPRLLRLSAALFAVFVVYVLYTV